MLSETFKKLLTRHHSVNTLNNDFRKKVIYQIRCYVNYLKTKLQITNEL